MLGTWAAQGKPIYYWNDAGQHIPYISDVAATHWGYPLFIAGSAVTVVVFDLAFVSERWLRHKGRLTQNYTTGEKVLSAFAILFAIIGAAGLILLTIFDTRDYPHVHDAMLVIFIAGYIISAIFICAEYQRLGIHYREHRVLRASFWIKLAFIFVEVALVIGFGVESDKGNYNTAAILEWTISLVYIFYVWSFIIDFLPATHTRNKQDRFLPPKRRADDEMAMNTEMAGNMTGGPVYSNGGHTNGTSRNF
ncbi:SFK1-like membrane protein [Teratosphaeria destructans]|uniref:SFK1-like membrane protein n=1 Tax=Teratosphaeria destructans TaxID=418781 RepID=A0A9W7SMY5_9PEZI|nr:SFK1-like membrane protein [Teratosphaeria destructans]